MIIFMFIIILIKIIFIFLRNNSGIIVFDILW